MKSFRPKLNKEDAKRKRAARKEQKDFIQETFLQLLDQVNIERPVPEYLFHEQRKWRFDYCWPEQKIVLEVEGGIFIQGRHSRGAGMKEDFDKYNEAAIYGYRIVKVIPTELCSFTTISLLRRILLFN